MSLPSDLERRFTRREEHRSLGPRWHHCPGASAGTNPALQHHHRTTVWPAATALLFSRRPAPVELVHRLHGAHLDDHARRLDGPGHTRLEFLLFGPCETAEDVIGRVHPGWRTSHADTDADVVRTADVCVHALHAVVASVPAAHLHLHAKRLELEVVVCHRQVLEPELPEAQGSADGLARLVHVGLGLHDPD